METMLVSLQVSFSLPQHSARTYVYLVKTPEQLGQALSISGAQRAQSLQQGGLEGAVLKGAAAVVVELQHLQLQA